jgi:hypothetical protein
MHRSVCTALTALTTALLLASAVTAASARNLSVSSQNFRAVWTNLETTNEIGEPAVRCSVTLEGSFHSRTLPKVARLLIGAVTRFNIAACTNGRLTPGTQVPLAHLTYESFTGTLPDISRIGFLLSRIALLMEVPGFCNGVYGSLGADNISLTATREGGGGISSLAPVPGRNGWTLTATLSGFCPGRIGVVGTGTLTVLNGTSRITVRLI